MVDGYSIFFPRIVKSAGRPPKASHHDAPLLEFYEEAYALCVRCPVIDECRSEYTRDPIPKDGMYFGKTPSQRTRYQTELHSAMLNKIRELVPLGIHLEDAKSAEAQALNDIHKILWGVNIPGYPDGYWE
jgi:hypothetical protein